jgi:hypothetical protein
MALGTPKFKLIGSLYSKVPYLNPVDGLPHPTHLTYLFPPAALVSSMANPINIPPSFFKGRGPGR